MRLASVLPLSVKRALRRVVLDYETKAYGGRAKVIRSERGPQAESRYVTRQGSES